VIYEDTDLLFYNGIAVVSDDLEKLMVLKKLLESDLFISTLKTPQKIIPPVIFL